jgi:hypothetical protein
MTFRTISTNSKHADSWIRPPTEGKHFAQQASEHASRLAPKAFQAYVDGLLEGSFG